MPISFEEIKERLAAERPLPGEEAQYLLAPLKRQRRVQWIDRKAEAKKAAVLATIVEKNRDPHLIYITRSTYPGVHSGQISFPGGQWEQADQDFLETALRESKEEVGLEASLLSEVRPLTDLYIPPSNFWVQPFLALADELPELTAEEKEVAEIHLFDINELLEENSVKVTEVQISNGMTIKSPAYVLGQRKIWGATAMITSEILAMLRQS